jgi:GNAT superfamily N-acetyltransferase
MGASSGGAARSDALTAFLREWLGAWPPDPRSAVTVVGAPERTRPGWDGALHEAVGVASPSAGAILSVPPAATSAVRAVARSWADLPLVLPPAMGRPEGSVYLGHLRWCDMPARLPEVGRWLPVDDPRLPDWLRPFGGEALVALDGDRYAAGVGLKRHNARGVEIAIGTDPAYRGRGLAARLCAQAARHVIATGAVPIYLHDPANIASARTADSAGFPHLGWQVLGMAPEPGP